MTEEVAKKASDLVLLKQELSRDLYNICRSNSRFVTGFYNTDLLSSSINRLNVSRNKYINNEVKEFLIKRINEKISEIDRELLNLQC